MREKQQLNKDAVVASGIWKFGENISEEELVELANGWSSEDTIGKYIDLYVRRCSKNQFGIGFKYVLSSGLNDPNPEDYNKFFHRMTDILKRRFGNDFVGWDVSSSTHIII